MSQHFSTRLPAAISDKLHSIGQRKRSVQAATAAAAAFAVLLAAMALAMFVDWLATLYDSPWRLALTWSAFAAAATTAVGWLLAARRSLRWEQIAADVDREAPEFEQRWTTVTDLGSRMTDARRVHPAMFRRVASEAVNTAPRVQPAEIVDMAPLVGWLIAASAVTAVLGLAVVLDARQTSVLFRRFWQPRELISATELIGVTDSTVVGRGEPFAVEASLQGVAVDRATLFIERELTDSEDGRRSDEAISLSARGNEPVKFVHRIEAVKEPFAFRWRAGDGQTSWRQIKVADRPEVQAVQLTVTPPKYTRQPARTFHEFPRQIAALKGSRLELRLRPTIPVKSASLQIGQQQSIALRAAADEWYVWETTLEKNVTLSPRLAESHGLANRRAPATEFSIYEDQPPAVKVLTPDDNLAVQPGDTLQISFSASDDVGIESAELLVYDDAASGDPGTPIASIPIDLGEQVGAASIERTVPLDLSKLVAPDGAELSYEIRVREDRGGARKSAPERPVILAGSQQSSAAPDAAHQAPAAEAAAPTSPSAPPAGAHTDSSTRSAPRIVASPPPGVQTPKPVDAPTSDLPEKPEQAMSAPMARGDDLATGAPQSAPPAEQSASDPSAPSQGGARGSRTASTGRKSLASSGQPAESAPTEAESGSAPRPQFVDNAGPAPKPAATDRGRESAKTETAERSAAKDKTASPPAPAKNQPPGGIVGQMAESLPANSPGEAKASTSRPTDSMTRRTLDVAQTASSQRMSLQVDQWAGSFAGQQAAKTAVAVGADLEAIDAALKKAEGTARSVLRELEHKVRWTGVDEREITAAEQSTVAAQEIVAKLQARSQGTPYAFVGLQVVDVGLAHVEPARSGLWKALQSEDDDRRTALADAAQHLTRARELIAELRGQFERTRREFELAAKVEQVKKMYQVYIENSQTLLQTQDADPTRYNREMMEFELDEEYLKRLKEVMEMRRDLRAELARILAEDPRLLRRFMDAMRNRANNLREELAELVSGQRDLNREVQAWAEVDDAGRPRMAQVLKLRQALDFSETSVAAGELQSRYTTWLALDREAEDPELAATTRMVQAFASKASELNAKAAQYVQAIQQQAASAAAESTAEAPAAATDATAAAGASLEPLLADGDQLYESLAKLDVALRQLATRGEDADTAAFAANRLVETRRLVASLSAWLKQMRAHEADDYPAAAEVDQYRLAMKTDELAGKLGGVEQTLVALMQRPDGTLPASIAEKAREFLAALDAHVSPNQLAAVYALRQNDLARAANRQATAQEALAHAEAVYDELMKLAIAEMDKLPVQDPIADLLDDPTLDELLAQLEQELPLEDLLGIPNRPSNFQIIDDWARPGQGGGGGGAPLVMNQVQKDHQRARQKLDRAYQRAVARALKETKKVTRIEIPESAILSDWNRLASQLGDDLGQGRDKAPPEQYRRAIEQYFTEIAREAAEQTKN